MESSTRNIQQKICFKLKKKLYQCISVYCCIKFRNVQFDATKSEYLCKKEQHKTSNKQRTRLKQQTT